MILIDSCDDCVISNNLIHSANSNAIEFLTTSGGDNMSFVNNTIYNQGDAGIIWSSGPDRTGIVVANNIIHGNGNPASVGISLFGSGVIADYNCVYDNNVNYDGTASAGAHDINIDPEFVSHAEFSLSESSPCIDAGAGQGTISSIPVIDLEGATRPYDLAGLPNVTDGTDIGAYEYFAPIYFVSASGGSIAPYNTPAKAATSITSLLSLVTIEDGDIIEVVDAGDITESSQITISVPNLTIRSYGTDGTDREISKPTLISSSTNMFKADDDVVSADGLKILNLHLLPNSGCIRAIYLENTTISGIHVGVEISGNIIDGSNGNLIYGIALYSCDDALCTNNIIRNANVGIGIQSTHGGENTRVYNNIIFNCLNYGIEMSAGILSVYIYNNIIHGNDVGQYGIFAFQPPIIHNYNCIHGVTVADYGIDTVSSPNNIDSTNNPGATDPMFFDPDVNDFRLLEGSPCIDAGLGDAYTPTIDIVGTVRPIDESGYANATDGTDIGAYEGFVEVIPPEPEPDIPNDEPEPIYVVPCEEPPIAKVEFWKYLTTFWDYLTSRDRESIENLWHGMTIAGRSIVKKGLRFFELQAPENARTCVLDDFYDIQIGPLYSLPINLDPTTKEPSYTIIPIGIRLIEPSVYNGEMKYADYIELSASDYWNLRNVAINNYVVISSKNEEIETRAFKILNMLSSEEAYDRSFYAEIDGSLNDAGDTGSFGKIALTGLYAPNEVGYEDLAEYTVTIATHTGASEINWGVGTLGILIDDTALDQIASVMSAAVSGTPWATISNKSGYGKTDVPLFALPTELDDMPGFVYAEVGDDRYYPHTGKVWQFFDGYSIANGDLEGESGKGEYVRSQSKFKYMMVVDGNLDYASDQAVSIYVTTARSYKVEDYVLDVPVLQISADPEAIPEYRIDRDFTFSNHIVEFFNDLFDDSELKHGDYIFCPKTPLIEHMLYDEYGNLVSMSDWNAYNHTSESGKAAINGLLSAIQNASNREQYERALNIYYGLPVCPGIGKVVGLYESFGYLVTDIDGLTVTLERKSGEDLHKFIQPGTKLFTDGKPEFEVDEIVSRANGEISLVSVIPLEVGDRLNVRLKNRYAVSSIIKEDEVPGEPAYIVIESLNGDGAIEHLIDVMSTISNGEIYPEVVIFGTRDSEVNYDGTYHITGYEFVEISGLVKLSVYKASEYEDPIYNDYIGITTSELDGCFLHIPWPTHKFLNILIDNERYYKAYLDAPIDTIYEDGDSLNKYQIIARNVSVMNNDMFPGWSEFEHFRRFHGLSHLSDILEATKSTPGANFGKYFPARYETTI